MMDNDSYNGNYKKNPFNFQHYNLTQIGISVNGEEVLFKPLKLNFDDKLIVTAYNTLFSGPGGDSTLIRRVCATGVLNLSPCSGVGKPKKDTLHWSYHFFLKSIVLYCIVLYWRQRSCLCFTYLIKFFYHSPLVLSCLCKSVLNFLLLLSV